MIKRVSLLTVFLLLFSLFFGCSAAPGPAPDAAEGETLRITATIFPVYDWVRRITDGVERAEVTLLLDGGVDMHSYQPTANDIVRISQCGLFLYVGGESDGWVRDVLDRGAGQNVTAIALLDALGGRAKEEELTPGMEEEEDEGPAYDEHVWLSLQNAAFLCRSIADTLAALDPENAAAYGANADAYIEKLSSLDGEYRAAVDAAAGKTLVVADRFPFRYLADDYGLDCFAAFAGCSAETEASFETIVFLAGKVDELGLRAIVQTESADGSLARTVRDSTASRDQEILTLDSLQSVRDAESTDYLSVMEQNLEVLREALGQQAP